MSSTYPEYINNFPDALDKIPTLQDVSVTTKPLVDQYLTYKNSGDFEGANVYLAEHPEIKNCMFTSELYNLLAYGILSSQRLYLDDVQNWIFNVSQLVGEYSPTVKYSKFNVVYYTVDGGIQFYQASKLDIPIGTLPTDTNYWICITLRGQKGDPGTNMVYSGLWNYLTEYKIDQFVIDQNCFWICVKNNSNSRPSKNNNNWNLMLEISGDLFTYDNSKSTLLSTFLQDAIDELDAKIETVNATLDSNMRRIIDITLTLDGWSENAPYTQTVSAAGMTAEDLPSPSILYPAGLGADDKKIIDRSSNYITSLEFLDGAVTAICNYIKPTVDLSVRLKGV